MSAYHNAHNRAKRLWGPASLWPCWMCDATAQDWAQDWVTVEAVEVDPDNGLPYTDDPHGYAPMCKSCHRAYDAAHKRDPDGLRDALPNIQRAARARVSDERRMLDARQRASQRRLYVHHHYPHTREAADSDR